MSDDNNSEEQSEVKNNFFHLLIERLMERYTNLDKKCIYKLLIKKCKFYYHQSVAMQNDPLWEKLVNEAENYKADQEETGVSESASFEYAMKQHKPIIMEMISEFINEEEEEMSEEEMSEDDDDETIVNENAVNEVINTQSGSGRGYRRYYRNMF